jgi:hypothetical protein
LELSERQVDALRRIGENESEALDALWRPVEASYWRWRDLHGEHEGALPEIRTASLASLDIAISAARSISALLTPHQRRMVDRELVDWIDVEALTLLKQTIRASF